MPNKSPKRGHWPAGKPRHPATRQTLALIADLTAFLTARKLASGIANPYSAKALGRETGVPNGSIRNYLSGRYLPSPETAKKIRAWLTPAKAAATRKGLL